MPNFKKIIHINTPYPRDIDYNTYKNIYEYEETHQDNSEFYPKDYETRKRYILDYWWGKEASFKRHKKINHIWNKQPPIGRGLELGFNWGGSVHWLLSNCPNITCIDGIEFSEYMIDNADVFKEKYGDLIGDFMLGSVDDIKKPDDYYDFINSCSLYEHLPDCVYWKCLDECYRVLKPNGLLGVYLDPGEPYGQHLRMDSLSTTHKDLVNAGFTRIHDYLYKK